MIIGYLGFADGEMVGDGGLRMLVFLGPWWLLPVAIYFGFTRTLFGLVCVGTGLFAATFLALPAVFDDWHSTAGVALLAWPVYFTIAIGTYLVLESVGLDLFERLRRSRQQ